MKIAIDAKWYFTGPVSTRVVLQNVLPALFELYPEHEWILFMDKKDKGRDLPFRGSNIKMEYVWARNNMLSNVFVLASGIRRTGADVAIFQTFPSLRHAVPAIAFIHDVLFREFPQFFTPVERCYFLPLPWLARNRADRLIATTAFVAGDLDKYHYTRDRGSIDIVPLGVSDAFRPAALQDPGALAAVRTKFGLPQTYLLYVGRLNIRKNIQTLLRALPLLRNSEIPLVIVGKEDWRRPDLRQLISDPAIGKRILLTGAMTGEELTATYAMATLFCFPSFAEGFGLPPLEAMAAGIPAIVSRATSLPEVCAGAAIYIDPGSAESIAAAVDRLLGDPVLYQTNRQLGLERARRFSWHNSAAAIMKSILNATKQKPT